MIKSLELRKLATYVCESDCKWNDQRRITNGGNNEVTVKTEELAEQFYINCSWQPMCNIFGILNADPTSDKGTWFMKMEYHCVKLVNMCEKRTTTLYSKTYYHLVTSRSDFHPAVSRECNCTIESEDNLSLSLVKQNTMLSEISTCAKLTVNEQLWRSCEANEVNRKQQSEVSKPYSIQLYNINSQYPNMAWIEIKPPSKDESAKVSCSSTTVGMETTTQSYKDAGDDDAGFPIAAAVSIPLAVIAVAAVVIAVLLWRRFQRKSKRDPDIYDGTRDTNAKPIPLDNPAYNKHAPVANQLPVANDNSVDTAGTEYAECGEIDEYPKPVAHRLMQKIGNGAGPRNLNGDTYDHTDRGNPEQTDNNYGRLVTKVPFKDDTYSHTNCGDGRGDDNLDATMSADIDTYNHLENKVETAPARERIMRTKDGNVIAMDVDQDKQCNKGAGNVYIEVLPDDDIVSGEDNERATTDHIPLHYEEIEKHGNDNVESAAAYTDLRGLDKNGPSTYQMLTPRTEQTSGTRNRSESPVTADIPGHSTANHDYFTLNSSPGLADVQDRTSSSHDYITLNANSAPTDVQDRTISSHDYITLNANSAPTDVQDRTSASHDYFTLNANSAPTDDRNRTNGNHDYFTLNSK